MFGTDDSDDFHNQESNSSASSSHVPHEIHWYLRACCLNDPESKPPRNYPQLSICGLGDKDFLIKNYRDVTKEAFFTMLFKEYSPLEGAGGFDLYQIMHGRFVLLNKPWTPTHLCDQLRGSKRKLYIKPKTFFELVPLPNAELLSRTRRKPDFSDSQMKKLAYSNPGSKSRFLEDFDPERSGREMRKMKRKIYCEKSKKASMYDEHGLLVHDQRDLCDCCERSCPGCHFPCPKCKSNKCGLECRSNRKYTYERVEVEGTNKHTEFVNTVNTFR